MYTAPNLVRNQITIRKLNGLELPTQRPMTPEYLVEEYF